MARSEHHHKGLAKHRVKIPPKVELHIQKRTMDVDAWLGQFRERLLEREVHPMADAPVQEDERRKSPAADPDALEVRPDRAD